MRRMALLLSCLLGLGLMSSAYGQSSENRHWIARIGVHPIAPKPNNHSDFEVGNGVALSLGATYLFTKHWGLEVFGALPAEHELSNVDGDRVGQFDLLPTAVTAQYHWSDARGRIRTYVGAGVAYAATKDEATSGALAGRTLRLGQSTGLAAAIGLDMNMGSRWFVNIDARWYDIDARIELDGTRLGQLEIDPYALGLSLGRRLR